MHVQFKISMSNLLTIYQPVAQVETLAPWCIQGCKATYLIVAGVKSCCCHVVLG